MDCTCTKTTSELLDMLNNRRQKKNLDRATYQWMLTMWKRHAFHFQPYRTIGRSYIWDGVAARRIVSLIWDKKYTPEAKLFRYSNRWAA